MCIKAARHARHLCIDSGGCRRWRALHDADCKKLVRDGNVIKLTLCVMIAPSDSHRHEVWRHLCEQLRVVCAHLVFELRVFVGHRGHLLLVAVRGILHLPVHRLDLRRPTSPVSGFTTTRSTLSGGRGWIPSLYAANSGPTQACKAYPKPALQQSPGWNHNNLPISPGPQPFQRVVFEGEGQCTWWSSSAILACVAALWLCTALRSSSAAATAVCAACQILPLPI
jgi:hypothetical protein